MLPPGLRRSQDDFVLISPPTLDLRGITVAYDSRSDTHARRLVTTLFAVEPNMTRSDSSCWYICRPGSMPVARTAAFQKASAVTACSCGWGQIPCRAGIARHADR